MAASDSELAELSPLDRQQKYEVVAELAWSDPPKALRLVDALLDTIDDDLWRGKLESQAAIALMQMDRRQEGRARFEHAAEVFVAGGHMAQAGKAWLNLGIDASNRGAFAEGIPLLVEAERIFTAEGLRLAQAWVQLILADAHIEAATTNVDLEAARSYLKKGLQVLGPEDPRIAAGELRLGPLPDDPHARTEWLELQRELDGRYLAYLQLARTAFLEDDAQTAIAWCDRVIRIAEAQDKPLNYLKAINFRASAMILDGQLAEGRRIFDETFAKLKAKNIAGVVGWTSAYGARAHLSAGLPDRALELALIAVPNKSNVPKRVALAVLVEIYKTQGEPAKALAHSEALNQLLLTLNSKNGRLLQASFKSQRRVEQAELETRAQRAMLAAAGLGLALLLVSCIVLFRSWRRSAEQVRASDSVSALQRTLNRELRHRFGNHLAALRAAVERHRTDDPDRRLDRIRQSIEAMSALDAVISSSDEHPNRGVDLGTYLETLLTLTEEIYAPRAELVWEVKAEAVRLEANRVFLVGLAVTEAVNNAFRHGFANEGTGTIEVSVKRDHQQVVVAVEDDGQGFRQSLAEATAASSGGLSILRDMSKYLSGSVELEVAHPGADRPGVRVILRVPLTPVGYVERALPVSESNLRYVPAPHAG